MWRIMNAINIGVRHADVRSLVPAKDINTVVLPVSYVFKLSSHCATKSSDSTHNSLSDHAGHPDSMTTNNHIKNIAIIGVSRNASASPWYGI